MGKLLYSAIMSLDGFVEDDAGNFDWAMPADQAHAFINDLMRPIGTHLYGRRMYETMMAWETEPALAAGSPIMATFAQIWQAADKVVYSRSLRTVSTARTRLEPDFRPEAVQQMKAQSDRDLVVGGAELGGEAFRAGLVDECYIFLVPISVGGGKRAFPADPRLNLELLDHTTFPDGMLYGRYRIRK